MPDDSRLREWFVPAFGPLKFRAFIGMLFLPYTGMVLAFVLMGAMVGENLLWDDIGLVVLAYFLAMGVGAHALDAIGSRKIKPWGEILTPRLLHWVIVLSMTAAVIVTVAVCLNHPLLWIIAAFEYFFVLAYNLELFGGAFHTDFYFALSWGYLPVLAGYLVTDPYNSMGAAVTSNLIGAAAFALSMVEIKASRRYKALKRAEYAHLMPKVIGSLADVLKAVSLGTMVLAMALVAWRVLQ